MGSESGPYNFLFHVSDEYNRLFMHNYNFTATQSVRLGIMIGSFVIWGILVYVWVKDVIAQLQFYTLTLWLIAISSLSCSAGREVVEKKLIHKLKEEKLKDGSIQPEQVSEVDLPLDEKSTLWRFSLIMYTMASTLVVANPIIFLIFRQDMFMGEVCKFYELAPHHNQSDFDAENSQQICLGYVTA